MLNGQFHEMPQSLPALAAACEPIQGFLGDTQRGGFVVAVLCSSASSSSSRLAVESDNGRMVAVVVVDFPVSCTDVDAAHVLLLLAGTVETRTLLPLLLLGRIWMQLRAAAASAGAKEKKGMVCGQAIVSHQVPRHRSSCRPTEASLP